VSRACFASFPNIVEIAVRRVRLPGALQECVFQRAAETGGRKDEETSDFKLPSKKLINLLYDEEMWDEEKYGDNSRDALTCRNFFTVNFLSLAMLLGE
jgi:hypothetical protein